MKVRSATTMEANEAQRTILVRIILREAELFDRLKLEFPDDTEVDFERTGDIFQRFGCECHWRGAEWDGTRTSILCNLFAELRRHVRYVRDIQNLYVQFARDVEMISFSSRT